MTLYRHKDHLVDVVQWRGDNRAEVAEFFDEIGATKEDVVFDVDGVSFWHSSTELWCDLGSWIVAYLPDAHAVDVLDDDDFRRDFNPDTGDEPAAASVPTRRRVWFAGDPEPRAGQRVLSAGRVWIRHPQTRWILPGDHGALGLEWERLNHDPEFPVVEVFAHEHVDHTGRLVRMSELTAAAS